MEGRQDFAGRTTVTGPGRNLAINSSCQSSTTAMAWSISVSQTATDIGWDRGRPLVS
jgi:hypothetical protein